MTIKSVRFAILLVFSAASALIACSSEPQLDVQIARAEPPAPAPTQTGGQAPGALPAGHPAVGTAPAAAPPIAQLPEGHPSVATGQGAAFELPPVDAEAGTGAAGLRWTAPPSWVAEPPANTMRRAQYRIPGPEGDAECVVFYFGPGQGGDPQSNVERWAGQFVTADGRPGTEAMKTRELDAGGVKILVVEAKGTYMVGSMMGGASQPRPYQALLGAVVAGPDANWFFKLIGPESTVEAQRQGFDGMLKSVKKGG